MSIPPTRAEILAAWDARDAVPDNFAAWCREIGSSRGKAFHTLAAAGRIKVGTTATADESAEMPPAAVPGIVEREEGDAGLTVKFQSDAIVTTLDDLIAKAQADMTVWRVSTWKAKAYTVPIRVRRGQGPDGKQLADEPHVKSMWLITASFERAIPDDDRAAILGLIERVKVHAPAYPTIIRAVPKRPRMLEIDLFDAHFGKLAWAQETGQNYDLKIAETVFESALDQILDEFAGHEFETIVFPVGNDFLQCDGPNNATTSGTVVDTDGRFGKIIEIGKYALIRAIDRARQIAPVIVPRIGGNHDRTSMQWMAHILDAWYRNCPDVAIDTSPSDRKVIIYGDCALGLAHGDGLPPNALPGVFFNGDDRVAWATAEHREIHCGHVHKAKQIRWTPVDTHDGTVVRFLHALSARDQWHQYMGFIGGRRAAEAFVWDKTRGLTNNAFATVLDAA